MADSPKKKKKKSRKSSSKLIRVSALVLVLAWLDHFSCVTLVSSLFLSSSPSLSLSLCVRNGFLRSASAKLKLHLMWSSDTICLGRVEGKHHSTQAIRESVT